MEKTDHHAYILTIKDQGHKVKPLQQYPVDVKGESCRVNLDLPYLPDLKASEDKIKMVLLWNVQLSSIVKKKIFFSY